MTFKFIAKFPPGYEGAAWALTPGNVIVLAHPNLPVVYLDEATNTWRLLEAHVSEVAKPRP